MKEKQLPDYFGKVPPQDVSMEKAVLGALLIDGNMDVFNVVSKIVTEDSFYTENHRIIFSALKRLHDRFAPVDLLTVSHEIKTIGKKDFVDDLYLTELTDVVATSFHVESHAMVVQELFIRREIIKLCHRIITTAHDNHIKLDAVINSFEREIKVLEEKTKEVFPDENKQLVRSVINNIIKIKDGGFNSDLFIVGNNEIDKVIKIMPGEIIFLAGAPKSAKTKVLIYIIDSLVNRYKEKLNIKWNSMEDPKDKVIRNRISMHTSIPDETLQGIHGHLTSDHIRLIQEVTSKIDNDGYLEYNDVPKTIDDICSDFRSFVKKDRMNILVIDNFNICTDLCHHANTTDREIYVSSKITHLNAHLKSNGYKCCTIVVDHLKKEQLDKSNKDSGRRPSTAHLKGSERKYATLTQLLLINRPGKYRDIVDEESKAPDILINGTYWKRKDILARNDSSGLILIEKTESRNSADTGDDVVARLYVKINTMNFKNLYEI